MKKHFSRLIFSLLSPILFCLMATQSMVAWADDALPELEGKAVSLGLHPVSNLELNRWYVMYNVGRSGFLFDSKTKLYISTAPPAADGMNYLVRLVEEGGKTYMQTGLGRYFKYLSTSNNGGSTETAKYAFTYGTIADGYFWFKDSNGMVLDANALGGSIDATSTVAGWGKDTPTSTTGNNSWRVFPVEFLDASDELADVPYSFGNFSFQSVTQSKFLHYDGNNMAFTDEDLTGAVRFTGDSNWSLSMPEGSGTKGFFHIGTDGKFSAGPFSPLRLYRVHETDESGATYSEVSYVVDGATYLIVGNYEGSDYALMDEVANSGTANQRMLSSKVTFADDGTASFKGSNSADARRHYWQLHCGESIIQDPFVYKAGETGGASGSGEPLLTIACVSDIHTQEGWLSKTAWADQDNGYYKPAEIKDVKVRESLGEAVKALQKEKVDVLIVGGDCQSDATVDEEHWRQVRRLMADALRSVKTDGSDVPVLYVNGNHEYEVASTWGGNGKGYYNWRNTRPFNAGEYYEFPMLADVGVLASDYDCFYEDAPNDGLAVAKKTMPVLGAYHYNIKGFDFVVLNCGKHLFHNANNYSYSDESVEWVASKLQQIYADDPSHTKPVFFALHIPFGDSNSMNVGEDKGMSYFASTHRLKQVLAQYPGLVMLYGHDHGQDLAYIRSKTSQRVTRYDTQGNVMATADGVETYDKDVATGEAQKVTPYKGQSVTFHPYSSKQGTSLGIKGTYLNGTASVQRTLSLLNDPSTCTLFPEPDGAVSLRIGDGSQYLSFTTGFNLTAASHQHLYLYRVNVDGDSFTLTRVQQAEDGEIYMIGSDTHVYRVGGQKVLPAAESYSVTGYNTFFWTAELPQEAQPSFFSSFMGSMRYYNNSNGDPANSSLGARKLVQGLLIYVYPDRIVFNMKNFRNNAQSRVRNELAPFVVKRATAEPKAVAEHNASKAYYRRVDDLSQLCDKSVCLFVDESRKRSFGLLNNATNKFQAVIVEPSEDGRIEASRETSECELVFEKKPVGAPLLPNDLNTWYLRTRDGYLKSSEGKVYLRQQALNYNTGNVLDNEAMNGRVVPWNVTLHEDGVVEVVNDEAGELRKLTTGMLTASYHLYQKVVDAPEGDGGIAAFYAEQALSMPEGVEAYTVEGLKDDGTLRFVRQTTKVPAKTGLVLRRRGVDASLAIPVIDDRYAPSLSNYLLGTLSDAVTTPPMLATTAADPAATDYCYYRFDGTRFVAADASASAFVNPAGTAYLALPEALAPLFAAAASQPIASLLDAAEVNGIKDVLFPENLPADAAVFTLAGQRIVQPRQPGLYIVGGKKMVVK